MTHLHFLHTFVQLSQPGTSKILKILDRTSSLGLSSLLVLISVVQATKLLATLPTRIEMQKAKNAKTTERRKQFFELGELGILATEHRKKLKDVESKCSPWRP